MAAPAAPVIAAPVIAAQATPAIAVSAMPERLSLAAGTRGTITVRERGAAAAELRVSTAGYGLDPYGRPLVLPRNGAWIRVARRPLLLRQETAATVDVQAAAPRGARAGDHPVVIFLTVVPRAQRAARVVVRVGVVVVVRVPGRIRRGITVTGVRVVPGRPRRLRLALENRGNVEEWLARGRLAVRLSSRGRAVLALRTPSRRLMPHSPAIFDWALPRRLHGTFAAELEGVAGDANHRYHLRL